MIYYIGYSATPPIRADSPFKLTVVKASDRTYRVNHYRKLPDIEVPDFASVVAIVSEYAFFRPQILREEPTLLHLDETEEKAIQGIRKLVLDHRITISLN